MVVLERGIVSISRGLVQDGKGRCLDFSDRSSLLATALSKGKETVTCHMSLRRSRQTYCLSQKMSRTRRNQMSTCQGPSQYPAADLQAAEAHTWRLCQYRKPFTPTQFGKLHAPGTLFSHTPQKPAMFLFPQSPVLGHSNDSIAAEFSCRMVEPAFGDVELLREESHVCHLTRCDGHSEGTASPSDCEMHTCRRRKAETKAPCGK